MKIQKTKWQDESIENSKFKTNISDFCLYLLYDCVSRSSPVVIFVLCGAFLEKKNAWVSGDFEPIRW